MISLAINLGDFDYAKCWVHGFETLKLRQNDLNDKKATYKAYDIIKMAS